jgi:molybdopterin synthase catalytic subunit
MSGILARVTSEPISRELVERELSRPGHGAQLVFSGVVRDHDAGRRVLAVTYDAYVLLAERTFREIAEEARARWGEGLRVVVVHRSGRLEVGEASLVVGVGAAHREEAYEASRYVIEQLKKRSPVWKQEHYAEGDSAWLSGHSLRGGASGP